MTQSTKALYNQSASRWVRGGTYITFLISQRAPSFLEMCEPVTHLSILDLGCGEGYCSRELKRRGAAEVYGIDLSESMIQAAQQQDQVEQFGIRYEAGCATDLQHIADQSFDRVLAVFLFNYLTTEQLNQCVTENISGVTSRGDDLCLVCPILHFHMRDAEYPFYFEVGDTGYFSQRDQQFAGRIWKRDGSWLDVQLVHKPLETYFDALQQAGFDRMPLVRELRVTPEHLQLDEAFFQPLFDYPLHLAIQVSR